MSKTPIKMLSDFERFSNIMSALLSREATYDRKYYGRKLLQTFDAVSQVSGNRKFVIELLKDDGR